MYNMEKDKLNQCKSKEKKLIKRYLYHIHEQMKNIKIE
jgi:hypothetical protein